MLNFAVNIQQLVNRARSVYYQPEQKKSLVLRVKDTNRPKKPEICNNFSIEHSTYTIIVKKSVSFQ